MDYKLVGWHVEPKNHKNKKYELQVNSPKKTKKI